MQHPSCDHGRDRMRENSPDSLLMSSADRRLEAEKYAVNEGTVGNLCISLNKPLRVNHVICQKKGKTLTK